MLPQSRPSDWQLTEWQQERDRLCRQLLANPSDPDRRAANQRLRVLAFLIKRYDPTSPPQRDFADLGSSSSLEEGFDLDGLQPINEPVVPLAELDARTLQLEYERETRWIEEARITWQDETRAFPVVMARPVIGIAPQTIAPDDATDISVDGTANGPAMSDDEVLEILMAGSVPAADQGQDPVGECGGPATSEPLKSDEMNWEKPCSARLAEWWAERETLRRQMQSDPNGPATKTAAKRVRLLSFLLERYDPARPTTNTPTLIE